MTPKERAQRYIAKADPAIEGQQGSTSAFLVAQALAVGFDLDDDQAWPLLAEYNRRCLPPFPERELRSKLKRVRQDSRKPRGYLLGSASDRRPSSRSTTIATHEPEPPISQADYTSVATAFLKECGGTFHGIDDVRAYLGGRRLVVEGERAGLVGIPGSPIEIIKRLGQHFAPDTLENAGFWDIARCRFPWATHKLIIPWLSLDGSVHLLQRRHLDQVDGGPKYIFPRGLKPLYPFGVEALRTSPKDAPIALCEGALDVLAIRTIRNWDRMGYAREVIPLGLPGVEGWRDSWAEYTKGREVWMALDNDTAGEKSIQKIANACHHAGAKKVTRWRPPMPAKDWAAFLGGQR